MCRILKSLPGAVRQEVARVLALLARLDARDAGAARLNATARLARVARDLARARPLTFHCL